MSQATIDSIVKVIEELSDEDRGLLDKRLAELDEAKWQVEAAEARKVAREAGIDQAHIDQTIRKLRYG
jgi:hypothetical protein